MEEVLSKNRCTGCSACMNICPKHAITMEMGTDGFMYPVINKDKCINCGLCKKTCPILNTKQNISMNKCYVGYNIADEQRITSSSGAIFQLIANYILDSSGIVIGAAFNSKNELKHIAITKKKDLESLKGSKYLQSDLENIFSYIKDNINKNKILFVGTPCQVAGLKSFLKKDYENLLCVDLFCHGVPTPKLFKKYISELENNYNDKVVSYNFRDNKTGWDSYSNTIVFKNNIFTQLSKDNDYMKLFLSDIALRNSCYNCNFKLGNKYSDITLGDFWGVKSFYPQMYNKEGVSAIIINTDKGNDVFDYLKKDIKYQKCNLKEILYSNPSLKYSCKKSLKRTRFFDSIEELQISELVRQFVPKKSFFSKLILKIKIVIRRYLN